MPQTTLRVTAGFLAVALAVATPRIAASQAPLPTLSPARIGSSAEPHGLAGVGRESGSVPGADIGVGPVEEPGTRCLEDLSTVAVGPIMEPHG